MRRLSTSDSPTSGTNRRIPKTSPKNKPSNLNAGAELLSHFQSQWHDIHTKSLENAAKAEEASKLIESTTRSLAKKCAVLSEFDTLLTGVLGAEAALKTLEADFVTAIEYSNVLEGLIDELQLKKEVEEQEKLQLKAKYQLALYKEKRVAEHETFKAKVASAHRQKVNEFEKLVQDRLKERQETFQAAYEDDLQTYKEQGKLEKQSRKLESTPSLEEIEVEAAVEDKEALDQFLADA